MYLYSSDPRHSSNPWLITVLVALATFIEVLDTTIAIIVLPYIVGGMGGSEDETSWGVTSYPIDIPWEKWTPSYAVFRLACPGVM